MAHDHGQAHHSCPWGRSKQLAAGTTASSTVNPGLPWASTKSVGTENQAWEPMRWCLWNNVGLDTMLGGTQTTDKSVGGIQQGPGFLCWGQMPSIFWQLHCTIVMVWPGQPRA